jgi:hypothetical protein
LPSVIFLSEQINHQLAVLFFQHHIPVTAENWLGRRGLACILTAMEPPNLLLEFISSQIKLVF